MSFSEKIHSLGENISFTAIRNIAVESISALPRNEQDQLYEELVRGTKVLNEEAHLNMYLRSYGLMHKAKIDEAFKNLPKPDDLFSKDIEIFDWGCGQGIATICLLDYLRASNLLHHIKRINLIEPSVLAVERAKDILSCYKETKNTEIKIVIKSFDDLIYDDIESYNCRKLHLFSNILDVASFDIAKFTQLFQQTQKGGNYIVCVGPLNAGHKRVDWFIDAINPSYRYFRTDKPKGTWIDGKDWTISLRIIATSIDNVEEITDIRKRINESQKHRQFFAGYVTDAISDTLANSDYFEQAEELMSSLSTFDVRSDKSLEQKEDINPILAVMSNIISRGMPTKAPVEVEELLSKSFDYSFAPLANEFHYKKTDKCNAEEIFHALHLIDPRFSNEYYNTKGLDSSFELDFIRKYLPQHGKTYLSQVFEPQRDLSSIVDVPNKRFNKDRRVDFALEIPYSTEGNDNHIGFVVEIDGAQFHSSMTSRIKDARREQLISERKWDVNTLTSIDDASVAENWENNEKFSSYLNILKNNFSKKLEGDWLNLLQFTLSPFAVARVEKIIVEAMIAGHLDLSAKKWKIVVIERDVPCAQMAINDIRELYNHLCELKGINEKLPEVEVTIISTPEFHNSALHGTAHPKLNQQDSDTYDICIDIAMLLRDKIANLPISIKARTYYVIRSSHYLQDIRTIYSAENIEYKPLVQKTSRGEYVEDSKRENILQFFLQNIFRKASFREGQLAILSRVLSNKTTIGLLPTGGGKSLTYQLAAMLQPGVTIIVDPLVSLMVDQYKGLVEQRIDASACINSIMTREEKSYCLGRMERGELQFMFLSPERFMMEDFREEILAMPRNNKVYFAYGVIDEVHTVSEWGHDFRPAYLQLGRNMTRFMETKMGEKVSIIGLTATASFDVLADVERELTLGGQMALDSDAIIRPEISERKELTYRIVEVKADFSRFRNNNVNVINGSLWDLRDCVADFKRTFLNGLLANIPSDIEKVNQKDSLTQIDNYDTRGFYLSNGFDEYKNAGIVFCPYRDGQLGVKDKETQYRRILGIETYITSLSSDYKVGTYIGGDDPKLMRHFIDNKQNIMVATKAFGMGIDKPNVRFTINITHPSSIESYVQEAGRGGRDKKNAISYLLYEPTELIDLSIENLSDANIPATFSWLNLYKDQFVEKGELKNLCIQYQMTSAQIQQLEDILNPFKINIDKDIQMYFHNNSFKGSYKERVILSDLAYGIANINNQPQNNNLGIFATMTDLNTGDYSYVEVHGENYYKESYSAFCQLIINEANNIATAQGWATLPDNIFANDTIKDVSSFGALLKEISRKTQNIYWRMYHRAHFMQPLRKAFCRRRDSDDTDKAIYRMCCIGLVDDVTVKYLDNDKHVYTLRVKKRANGEYYKCLQSFFEKYYSVQQASQLVVNATNHGARTEIENCLGYLTEFIYEKLEDKRRHSIDDMQTACQRGISQGDEALKSFIHLYFNAKYAKDQHYIGKMDENGDPINCSLNQDIRQPHVKLIMKYIDVISEDPSGSVVDNVKHLYGAVLRVLLDKLTDPLGSSILYILRSYCLAFLGVGSNDNLLDEFKTSYWNNGLHELININNGNDPVALLTLINNYNNAILKDTKDDSIKQFIHEKRIEVYLTMTSIPYNKFAEEYLN